MDGGGGAAAHLCGAYGLRACGKPCAAVYGLTYKNNLTVWNAFCLYAQKYNSENAVITEFGIAFSSDICYNTT